MIHTLETKHEVISTTSSEVVSCCEPKRVPLHEEQGFFAKREVIMVILTALGLGGSIVLGWVGASPTLVGIALLVAYVNGGYMGLVEGWASLRKRQINVDVLMILAAFGAALVNQAQEGALLLFLFLLSNVLQHYAMERSRNAIRALMKLRPNEASVRRDGEIVVAPVESLQIGEIVVIRPGERLPVDGEVIEGMSAVDQASITGESMPVTKGLGDTVFAGTVNGAGGLEVRTTRTVSDTTLARIIKMVEEAQDQRAPTQRFMAAFEQTYAKIVILVVALYIILPPLVLGVAFSGNFYRAMVLLTALSPCALIISTPAAILAAIAHAARRGVLFKGGAYLEMMATLKVVAFDKTGTITAGRPVVTDVVPFGETDRHSLLALTAALEARSEHPIALAILTQAKIDGITLPEPTAFEAILGRGVSGLIDGVLVRVGTMRLMAESRLTVPPEIAALRERFEAAGKTVVIAHHEKAGWLGVIAVADEPRPNAKAVIARLRREGIKRIVMLTGDNARAAAEIATQVGVDDVRADLLPGEKLTIIRELQGQYGKVAMIGDGVNDAPALAAATIGMAMGAAGTDVALETADVVLMADDLNGIADVIALSHRTRRVMIQNISFALGVIVVLVIGTLGFNLPLPLGVIGHEGSTLIVVLNSLKLLSIRRQS
ncbi:MAG TPA: heavy metal translocating P-type ATPase [Aggregatilineales bacterium]|nr:cadmium-translocating P-type ATPase [Anaerolineales bacterium]HRE48931.1 heavy metal translocating P-type ATPase [Aggregatilineales bacterium]